MMGAGMSRNVLRGVPHLLLFQHKAFDLMPPPAALQHMLTNTICTHGVGGGHPGRFMRKPSLEC